MSDRVAYADAEDALFRAVLGVGYSVAELFEMDWRIVLNPATWQDILVAPEAQGRVVVGGTHRASAGRTVDSWHMVRVVTDPTLDRHVVRLRKTLDVLVRTRR